MWRWSKNAVSIGLKIVPRPAKICSLPKCDDKHVAHGYCRTHYDRWRRSGTSDRPIRKVRLCEFPDCTFLHCALGFCSGHYGQFRRRGSRNLLTPLISLHTPIPRVVSYRGQYKTCTNGDCKRKHTSRGLCKKCYYLWLNRRKGKEISK